MLHILVGRGALASKVSQQTKVVASIHSIINKSFLFFEIQIRQEKPYYIADPEVDSLVSCYSNFRLCVWSVKRPTNMYGITLFQWRRREDSHKKRRRNNNNNNIVFI